MAKLCLIPLGKHRRLVDNRRDNRASLPSREATEIDETNASRTAFGLWMQSSGVLRAGPLDSIDENSSGPVDGEELLAAIKCCEEDGTPVWHCVPRSSRLGIDGTTPLSLARVEPGTLLSVDRDFWLLTRLWRPEAKPAPEEIAQLACPVCGDPLSAAPVVECPTPGCGRYTHLERPEEPDSADALNCFLVAEACGGCGQATTLKPVLLPEVDQKLLPVDDDDLGFEFECLPIGGPIGE